MFRWLAEKVPDRLARRLNHAADHLARRLEADLLLPVTRPDSEQMALAMLKTAGTELHTAGQALYAAAERLKFTGSGIQANQARQAGTQALRAAEALGA